MFKDAAAHINQQLQFCVNNFFRQMMAFSWSYISNGFTLNKEELSRGPLGFSRWMAHWYFYFSLKHWKQKTTVPPWHTRFLYISGESRHCLETTPGCCLSSASLNLGASHYFKSYRSLFRKRTFLNYTHSKNHPAETLPPDGNTRLNRQAQLCHCNFLFLEGMHFLQLKLPFLSNIPARMTLSKTEI